MNLYIGKIVLFFIAWCHLSSSDSNSRCPLKCSPLSSPWLLCLGDLIQSFWLQLLLFVLQFCGLYFFSRERWQCSSRWSPTSHFFLLQLILNATVTWLSPRQHSLSCVTLLIKRLPEFLITWQLETHLHAVEPDTPAISTRGDRVMSVLYTESVRPSFLFLKKYPV